MKENNIIKKSMFSSLIFVVLVVIVFYFVFKETTFKEITQVFYNCNKFYIIIAIFCMFLYNVFEALNLKIVLTSLKDKIEFKKCYKYAIGAFFVAAITPSSSGGDPMAFYLMSKDKISPSHTVIALLIKLLIYQSIIVLLSIISFTSLHNFVSISMGNLRYLTYLGIFLNFLVFSIYFLLVFNRQILDFIIELFAKLLNKLHYKKTDSLREKVNVHLNEYSDAVQILKKNKKIFIKTALVTLFQVLIYFSIPYFVYLALGYHDTSILKFIGVQSVLHATVSSLPFPGAVGASEAVFMKLYKTLFNPLVLGSAMFITRFINFYLFLIYTGILLLIFIAKDTYFKENRITN